MAETDRDSFWTKTRDHYRDKFAEHGSSPLGVDWNGSVSQEAHFAELLRVLPADSAVPVSVSDLGCGYGALAAYLAERRTLSAYHGYDINEEMIAAARETYPDPVFSFDVSDVPLHEVDYALASGIFTLRLDRTDEACWQSMIDGLDALHRSSRLGFAFNCLTSYSDKEKMRDYLYYPDPCRVFDHCKRHYSREVALLHDYGVYAFTIIVRKPGPPA